MSGRGQLGIWPEDLARWMATRKEESYLLVDVREEREYRMEHLPGALHLPLNRLVTELPAFSEDRDTVFYCQGGPRSDTAALFVSENRGDNRRIFSMTGGIAAWEGHLAEGLPRVVAFCRDGTPKEVLWRAMAHEKAAGILYGHLADHYRETPLGPLFTRLGQEEKSHARIVWREAKRLMTTPLAFADVYDGLDGSILENGMPFSVMMERFTATSLHVTSSVLELALSVELAAFDLYRTMAETAESVAVRKSFFALAQAEKEHMRILSEGFSTDL